jgi:hypothetical protein
MLKYNFFAQKNCLFNYYIYLRYFIAINTEISYNKSRTKTNHINTVKVSTKRLP